MEQQIDNLRMLKEAFCLFDKDGDGMISQTELRDVLLSLRPHSPDADNAEQLIAQFDRQEKGSLDYIEFVEMMRGNSQTNQENELLAAFRLLDPNQTGKISQNELRHILSCVGDGTLPESEVEEILHCIQPDNAGYLNYNDFITEMNSSFQF
uniref:EF-hand domain-containing protein n=1 Tax=Vannella robusta TaxID=1487602 RepID=A0A7S4MHL0_9EUKA|mmetsp:Transcript_22357/g.28561  ORF Transcript_22357/g.28561 Transcript_22357/m.28561 type:complete len:152 (+) Transcript_22357:2-457(+)